MKFISFFSRYSLYIILFSTIAVKTEGFPGKYPIENFTPKDYKAGIQNIDFAQNRDMSVFVANNLGVLSFNGNSWKKYAYKSGKKQRSLAFDKHTDRLYVGSQEEFGYFYEDWKYVSLSDELPSNLKGFDEVWDVFLANSKAYFCTFQGIYVFDGEGTSLISHERGLDRSFLVGGKLITQNTLGNLFEVRGNELISIPTQNNQNQIIAGIVTEGQSTLLFYNSGKVESLSTFGNNTKFNELINSLKGKYVNHVLKLSDTRVVISTQTSGLFLYDLQNGALENITIQDGLLSNACLRTFQDYSGKLWVGMQNGIALININAPMRFINNEISLQGSGYEAYEDTYGTYFTTSNGIYFLAKGESKSIFLPGTEGPAYGLQKIAGKLYAGHHTGLFLLENKEAFRIAETDGLWKIKQLKSNPEYAIAGTYSGLYLFKIDPNFELQPIQKINGFDESSRFFEEDQNGKVWVGQFYKGLFQLDLTEDLKNAKAKRIPGSEKLPIDDQIIISEIDNELFLATRQGLYKIDQGTDQIVKAENFYDIVGQQPVYLLKQDSKKNIHIVAENLVGFFRRISPDNYVFVPSSLFQLRYSFNNDLLNVSSSTGNGVLFNANEGFIHYIPDAEEPVNIQNPLFVNKVFSATRDSVLFYTRPFGPKPDISENLIIPQNTKVIQFHVESYQFNEVNDQQFRYFLQGLDDDYSEWTNATFKEYTNLKEGDYEFIFQTRNHLGEIISSSPQFVSVKPPFHRSQLAKYIYIALGLFTIFLVSRFQKFRYKQKARELEREKQWELDEKQQRLQEIEKQKDQELFQLRQEKMQSELRHLNNLLAASTMNLVVKNEFMETIKDELKDIKHQSKNTELKRSIEKVVKEIDTTLRLQQDWEQFEYHFDQVHGDFLSRLREEFLDLTPNEQKLCAFLRLNLNTKEIANLMSISLRGVEVARYRLRKKLNLDTGQNLSKFVLEY